MRLFCNISFFIHPLLLLFFFFLTGCVQTSFTHDPSVAQGEHGDRILIMPIDIELSRLNVGGVYEPHAEWTAKAKQFVTQALDESIRDKGLSPLTDAVTHNVVSDDEKRRAQLLKLHDVVGWTILGHHYNPAFKLPTKKGEFDWSLGPETRYLKEKHGSDYALFVFLRDSYASEGRVAVIIVSALFGVGIPGGSQVGFASLVDLESGQIVWFNRLARGTGDLRTEKAARESVDALLADFPL